MKISSYLFLYYSGYIELILDFVSHDALTSKSVVFLFYYNYDATELVSAFINEDELIIDTTSYQLGLLNSSIVNVFSKKYKLNSLILADFNLSIIG